MIRLFVASPLKAQKTFALSDKQAHYLLHVMRCKVNDVIACFNGQDGEWSGSLVSLSKKEWGITPSKQIHSQSSPDFCALCPALIKKDNFDLVLQKATELNVTDIYPLKLEHSVVSTLNMERAQTILIEAAEQCERLTVPTLHEVMDLQHLVKALPKDTDICYLSERGQNVIKTTVKKPAFVIGPEGGFTPKELAFLADQENASSIHFPDTILRAETASLAALSCWQFGSSAPYKK